MASSVVKGLKHFHQFVCNIQLQVRVEWQIQHQAECYICHKTLTKSCIFLYKQSVSALSVLLYFTLKDLLTEDTPLKFNALFY